eukprot:Skav216124  [mRNA]  locus=scaffold1946:245285:245974:+ [translate_table: standard]
MTGACCTTLLCRWLSEDEESIDYGDIQYWLTRYNDRWYQQPFDWLGSFGSLQPWISPAAAGKQRKVVHLGCGTSLLAEEMHDSGKFGEIWNVDISEVCLQIMRQRNEQLRPALRWVKADLRDSKTCSHLFEANYFDCAIDKSTLDSICDGGRDDEAAKYITEVSRILKPAGIFLMFSFSPPGSRLQHLSKFFSCKVEVAEDQCFVYRCSKLPESGTSTPRADANEKYGK